jgi:hypothetical protein
VDHHFRTDGGQRGKNGVPVARVELTMTQGHHFLVAEGLDQLPSQLTTGSRDQRPHVTALSGSHHQRLFLYHWTVSANASSSPWAGAHPRALILEQSTE